MDIQNLYDQLCKIRTYLIKIGPERRKGAITVQKLNEANLIKVKYEEELEIINDSLNKLGQEEIISITNYCSDFDNLYDEILKLCKQVDTESNFKKMESFELRVALNLLPVMNDIESNTKQLIDGIEYYDSILNTDSKNNLINFILKTRLSQSAKLKLLPSYNSVPDLLKDMKKCLLSQKSAPAIQKQMFSIRQNDMSINDFGKKLSEMFVELTISQSDGDSQKYNCLKQINEKQAIKQFADGLRNRRLGTIISAQRLDSLKDAIQVALDEEVAQPTSSNEIMTFRNNFSQRSRGKSFYYRNNRGQSYRSMDRQERSYESDNRPHPQQFRGGWRRQTQGYRPRGRQLRGKFYINNNFNRKNRSPAMQILTEPDSQPTCSHENNEGNQFFRD